MMSVTGRMLMAGALMFGMVSPRAQGELSGVWVVDETGQKPGLRTPLCAQQCEIVEEKDSVRIITGREAFRREMVYKLDGVPLKTVDAVGSYSATVITTARRDGKRLVISRQVGEEPPVNTEVWLENDGRMAVNVQGGGRFIGAGTVFYVRKSKREGQRDGK